jgi:hypothetical protein
MKDLTESQVLSVNEIRASGGYGITHGGESILVNSGRTPLSSIIEAPDFMEPEPEPEP